MAKKLTRSKSVKTHLGEWSAKIRDAESPGAPTRVSSNAQAKNNDKNHAKMFNDGDGVRDRPSTSGGPGAKSLMQKKSGKRETKDDLYFNPLRAHGVAINDLTMTYFTFPAPNSPTPVSPPKSSPLPRRKSSVRQVKPKSPESRTPDKARMNVQPPEGGIGMALGSPTHLPVVGTWQSQIPFESASRSFSPDTFDNSTDGGAAPAPITKSSKWKILGGFFGGGKKPQSPFYQLQHEVPDTIPNQHTIIQADPVHAETPSSSEKKIKPRREKTISERKPEMRKPDMKRANTTPLNLEFESSRSGITQVVPPKIRLDGNPMASDNPKTSQNQGHQGNLLNVDIPSIQMERYSIMFGSVLQKPTSSSSTLLARRQATLDKLNKVNEALTLKEKELDAKSRLLRPRRGTEPTKSPALSLFPSTPSKSSVNDASEPPSLSRSNTSPAALSPSWPSFPNAKYGTVKLPLSRQGTQSGPVSSKIQTTPRTHNTDQTKQAAKPATRSLSSPVPEVSQPGNWPTEESHLESPVSDDEDVNPIFAPTKPKLDEGTWRMVTSHHPAPLSGSSSNASGSDISNSGASTATTPPHSAYSTHKISKVQPPPTARTRARSATTSSANRPKHVEIATLTKAPTRSKHVEIVSSQTPHATSATDLEEEERLKTAADVSIARQISISRDQRKLLVPEKSASNSSLNNKFKHQNFPSPIGVARSPLAAVAAERTLISSEGEGRRKGSIGEVRAGLAVHRVTGEQGHRRKRSERAIVEKVS
ncbi:hypothetical protein B7494_g4538 [Chlorociboria aeruginascens]|nr:hypothetical protein B7494_g4538 [Chlorociboria aeruginascens]